MKSRIMQIVFFAALLLGNAMAQAQTPLVTPDGHVLMGGGGMFMMAAPAVPVNQAPVASAVTLSGTATVGQVLTVAYTYTDTESNPQGTSIYKWYRADNATGTNSVAISGATLATYTLVVADAAKYITVGVTPVATVGTSPGAEVKAAYTAAVQAVANDAPVASAVTIAGTANVGQVLTVSYAYSDAESNPQGTSTYKWYRADDATGTNSVAISGATLATYTLVVADAAKYITAGVTPVATAGTSPGVEVKAAYTAAVTSVFSCGGALIINHVTTGGVSPVNTSISYHTVSTNISGAQKCWITQNLGASQQATSATDATDASAGWYWQFDQKQGHKLNSDHISRTPDVSWLNYIYGSAGWAAANDPCTLSLGAGWRLPTNTEWTVASGSLTNNLTAYASVLKLHGAGLLYEQDGSLSWGTRGEGGRFWSSNTNVDDYGKGDDLYFNNGPVFMSRALKAYGFSVRCLKD